MKYISSLNRALYRPSCLNHANNTVVDVSRRRSKLVRKTNARIRVQRLPGRASSEGPEEIAFCYSDITAAQDPQQFQLTHSERRQEKARKVTEEPRTRSPTCVRMGQYPARPTGASTSCRSPTVSVLYEVNARKRGLNKSRYSLICKT